MTRFDEARRRAVLEVIPPRKCGRTTREGVPCKRWASVGAEVCTTHGGRAPQVRAKAEERVTLAEALKDTRQRHPWEVLEHTAHIADVLMQQVLVELEGKGTVSPSLIDRLVQALERANRLAKTTLDAGVDQRRVRLAEAQAGQMHAVFTRVLAGLGLTQEQKALVPMLLKREIEGVLVESPEGRKA